MNNTREAVCLGHFPYRLRRRGVKSSASYEIRYRNEDLEQNITVSFFPLKSAFATNMYVYQQQKEQNVLDGLTEMP